MKLFALALSIFLLMPSASAAYTGIASFYGGTDHLCGHRMANGKPLNCRRGVHTVANRTLPMGTKLRITYQGKSVDAVVTDRGPAAWTHRVLDLSLGTARDLGMRATARVESEVIGAVRNVSQFIGFPHNEAGGPNLFDILFGGRKKQEPHRRARVRHPRLRHHRHR